MIGVLGATGRVGRHVAAGLAERGIEARALVRRHDPRLPLPAVHTDLSVPATLAPAFDGVERLLLLTVRRRGLPVAEIDHATRMAASFASGADSAATDHVLRLTGRAPRSIEAFLDEHASAFSPTTRLAHALSPAPRKDLIRP